MKKRVLALALLCFLLLALPAAAADAYVYDVTGRILTQEQWQELNGRAGEISKAYACGVYIAVVEDYSAYGSSMQRAAENIYRDNGFGLYDDASGILLLMSMGDRDYGIYANGFGTYALSSSERARLEDAILDNFRSDDWYGGFRDFLETGNSILDAAYRDYESGAARSAGPAFGTCLAIGLIVGVLAALIVCSIFKAQMKSVAKASGAQFYAVPGSMDLYESADQFSHVTESRVKVESDSDRGGGSRPSGGSSYSGGKF